jgi:hypothetical protein
MAEGCCGNVPAISGLGNPDSLCDYPGCTESDEAKITHVKRGRALAAFFCAKHAPADAVLIADEKP